ncbi:hypothetical protein ACU11_08035 [Xanthomonas oryzae pv. oryzicola]|nr:hypothetical protein ACU11_08035 [Xanthomonas oryzae pv. oryzicola]
MVDLEQALRLQLQVFGALAHQLGQTRIVGLVAMQQHAIQQSKQQKRAKHRGKAHILALPPQRQYLERPHRFVRAPRTARVARTTCRR